MGEFINNEHHFVLKDPTSSGRQFALSFSRQLVFTHTTGFSISAQQLPIILKPRNNARTYEYEYPLVLEKICLEREFIDISYQRFHCGSLHNQCINGFHAGLFSGVFLKYFSSWPMTNRIYPPKTIAEGKNVEDYSMRLVSQWTLNGLVRTFRVLTVSIAAALMYDFSHQMLTQARNKEDYLNPIFSGAVVGSIMGSLRGFSKSASSALIFAFFASCYDQIDCQNSKLNKDSFPTRNSAFFF